MRRRLAAALIAGGLAMLGGGTAGAASVNGYHTVDIDPYANAATSGASKPTTEYGRALAAIRAKQYRLAANAADHVLQAEPHNVFAWRLLGVALAGDRDWRGSRKSYERAVRLAPDDPLSHAGLGLALANLRDARAKDELDWLKARAKACGDACPQAPALKTLAGSVEGALYAQGAEPLARPTT